MIDVAEGRRLKAAADVELLAYVATATECGPEHEGHQESWNAVSRANASWVGWITANIAALLDAAEDAERLRADRDQLVERCNNISADAEQELKEAYAAKETAERELAEVQGDAERFEWWFNRDVDKRDFMPTYFQGIRERWSLSNWRAAIDAERGK